MKKQKRERSKRKKTEQEKVQEKVIKKEIALQHLKEAQKKQFENFKQNIIAQTKTKLKSKHKIKTTKDEYYQTGQVQHRQPHRSKSKKKLDDEKENRRISLSPQPNHMRSGGRSKSDKRKHGKKHSSGVLTSVASEAQLFHLTQKLQKAGVFDFINNKEQEQNVFQIKHPEAVLRKSNTMTGIKQIDFHQQQQEFTPIMTITKKRDNAIVPESA